MTNEPVYTTLLADDVTALRRLIKIALERSGRFRVVAEAENGAQAVEQAVNHRPHLILLDLSMPVMDGLEALPRILEGSPGSKVIILSGFNHARMAPVALRMGAVAYLEKGIEPSRLVQTLIEALDKPSPPSPVPASPSSATRAVNLLFMGRNADRTAKAEELLQRFNFVRFDMQLADCVPEAMELIRAKPPDAIVMDLASCDSGDPQHYLIELLSATPQTPVTVLVSQEQGALASAALKLGAEDCLAWDRLNEENLPRAILYSIERRHGQAARRAVETQRAEVERLKSVEQLKTDFFNAAAHELGTPLTPIKLQVHMLKSSLSSLSAPQQRSVEIIERNVERLSNLTQDLLDVARLQAGKLRLNRQWGDLASLVREAADSFAPVAAAQGLNFHVDIAGALLAEIDGRRITQVLYNLINNALKFTPRGGTVQIELVPSGDDAVVLVHDTGLGMAPEQMARLFQPFSQVHDVAVSIRGTGLGLYVSKGIVELHGGRIWCESLGPGKGSTFAFALKMAKVDPLPLAAQPQAAVR